MEQKTQSNRIAALLTCHNRRDKTLACLDALTSQQQLDGATLQVYLVDDGSTDGTAQAVKSNYPQVKLLHGDGNLYWCRSVHLAWAEALKHDYDYYLWLNDDAKIYPHAVHMLLQTAKDVRQIDGRDSIIVGTVGSPDTGEPTYGGVVKVSKWRPLAGRIVQPADTPQRCDTFNGNCVLIPRDVALQVGNVSTEFSHWFGDTDYGLRTRKKGFSIWVAPGFVGTCKPNPDGIKWADPNLPLRKRLKIFYSPKGLPPREWTIFIKRHAGLMWPYYWLNLHLRFLFPRFWMQLKKKFAR